MNRSHWLTDERLKDGYLCFSPGRLLRPGQLPSIQKRWTCLCDTRVFWCFLFLTDLNELNADPDPTLTRGATWIFEEKNLTFLEARTGSSLRSNLSFLSTPFSLLSRSNYKSHAFEYPNPLCFKLMDFRTRKKIYRPYDDYRASLFGGIVQTEEQSPAEASTEPEWLTNRTGASLLIRS